MSGRKREIPGWPAMLKRDLAAAYCDMSIPSFEGEIIAGRLPAGVMFGGREHWHRNVLDRAIAAIAGECTSDAERSLLRRYGKAA